MFNTFLVVILLATMGLAKNNKNELIPVEYVDIERFMGDWYVVGVIPTFAVFLKSGYGKNVCILYSHICGISTILLISYPCSTKFSLIVTLSSSDNSVALAIIHKNFLFGTPITV